ncbi:MAG TPA: phosphate acyltransferase PlsX [Armatimonadota bacterium]
MTRVAVDAMGGDNAPAEIVRGAVMARSESLHVLLVGQPDALQSELAACRVSESDSLRIVPASDVVAMDESPSIAARRKKDSSMAVALDLVKRGEADAAVSAGNSGAMMALSLMTLGRIRGIERPAIATVFPVPSGGFVALLDAGANVDCSAENLLQFAIMGNEFSRCVLNVRQPKVAVLSIGEEATKGNALTREAAALIASANLRFIGNVEGRHIFTGDADVVVCDGFVGNVTLKAAEGTAEAVGAMMALEFQASLWRMLLGYLTRPIFRDLKKRTAYDSYGGAPLLGVNGVAIISHGRSNARAMVNAIREAEDSVKSHIVERIRTAAAL